jgi:hypothetical protein
MERWYVLNAFMPILGGLLACASWTVKNAASSRRLLNLLLPYKALVGVGLLGSFAVTLYDASFNPFVGFDFSTRFGILFLAILGVQLILGFTMGFGLVAKWIPGDSDPEERAEEVQRKLMPFEVFFGLFAIAAGVFAVLWVTNPVLFF